MLNRNIHYDIVATCSKCTKSIQYYYGNCLCKECYIDKLLREVYIGRLLQNVNDEKLNKIVSRIHMYRPCLGGHRDEVPWLAVSDITDFVDCGCEHN